MEKVYDSIDWGLLEEVLKETGFKPTLIKLIMEIEGWKSKILSRAVIYTMHVTLLLHGDDIIN